VESNRYEALRDALAKLQLNDSSLRYEPETSMALGFGFRCGFLGLLHMDIVQERLEREYDMELITTAPTVVYQVAQRDGTVIEIDNPSKLPDPSKIEEIREPMIRATIIMPQEYVGPVMTLCEQKRGVQVNLNYVGRQVILTYDMPLNEIVMDFFDKLKSNSRGYASSTTSSASSAPATWCASTSSSTATRSTRSRSSCTARPQRYRGRELAQRMRGLIPRQMFDIAVQAAIGSDVVARESIKALPEERARQVLRRRHHPQEEAPGEAEGGQEAHEAGRQRRDPPGGVPRHPAGRVQITNKEKIAACRRVDSTGS
jgi:GTP-binding protein LepA